tara:strand:- start:8153 stop:9028 length:876 start_codon:yes stop_codon:yes gene_type:complete
MTSITFDIRQALTGDEKYTSEGIDRLLSNTTAEITRVSEAVAQDRYIRSDIEASDAEHAEAQQRLDACEIVLERLTGALPKLNDLRAKVIERERDQIQKVQYAQLVKRRNVVGKQLEEFLEGLPAVANALHEAVQLKAAAQRFNHPAKSSPTTNPQDVMVSEYDHLTPLVTDAVLKNTRLMGSDGTVLFAPIDASVSMPPATAPIGHIRQSINEDLQYAKDMQMMQADRLKDFQQMAAQRSISVEQVALSQGIDEKRLQMFCNIAEGKMVQAIENKIAAENEKLEAQKQAS